MLFVSVVSPQNPGDENGQAGGFLEVLKPSGHGPCWLPPQNKPGTTVGHCQRCRTGLWGSSPWLSMGWPFKSRGVAVSCGEVTGLYLPIHPQHPRVQ
jgi:hypothetical protein